MTSLLLLLLWLAAGVGALLGLLCMVGANAYDLRAARRQRDRRRQPHARRYRRRPLISVIVVAENDAARLEACLTALMKNSYRKLEVIIVDNASKDHTPQVARVVMERFPKRQARLIAKRRPVSVLAAAEDARRRHGHGELVMLLSPADCPAPDTFTKAVRQLCEQPDINVLLANRQLRDIASFGSLTKRYAELWSVRAKKFNSTYGNGLTIGAEAILCRTLIWRQLLKTLRQTDSSSLPSRRLSGVRSYYAEDVIISSEDDPSLTTVFEQTYQHQLGWLRLLRDQRANHVWLRWPMLLIWCVAAAAVPLLGGYFIYLAYSLHEPALLLVSWGLLAIWLLTLIWSLDELKLPQKVGYTLGLPVTFGLFYILSFAPALAALRSLAAKPA